MAATETLQAAASAQPGELFRQGQLSAAINAQLVRVKEHPADHGERLFLFELLVFGGEYERAGRQIAAINYGDPTLDSTVAIYRRLLDAEQIRAKVFRGEAQPRFLSETPAHATLRLQAVAALHADQTTEAAKLLNQAVEQAPAVQGKLNDRAFSLLVDCDDVFGTILEVISATGAYFWVPLEQVQSLEIEAPRFPRDLIWLPAKLELTDGQQGDVFLNVLYPASAQSGEAEIQLGRRTDWHTSDSGPTLGLGTRLFLVDDDVVGLPEWRTLQITR